MGFQLVLHPPEKWPDAPRIERLGGRDVGYVMTSSQSKEHPRFLVRLCFLPMVALLARYIGRLVLKAGCNGLRPRTILFVNDDALATGCSGRVMALFVLPSRLAVAQIVDDHLGGSE